MDAAMDRIAVALERQAAALEGLLATASGTKAEKADKPAPKAEKAEKAAPKTEKAEKAAPKTEKADGVPSADALRTRAAELSAEHGGDKVRELASRCGASKISGLTEEGRAELAALFDKLAAGTLDAAPAATEGDDF